MAAKSKNKGPKEENWKGPRLSFFKVWLGAMVLIILLKMELQNPPQKVDVGVLATDIAQGVKDVGNGLIEMGRSPMYIESRPIRPFEYPVGPSNRVRRCTYCD